MARHLGQDKLEVDRQQGAPVDRRVVAQDRPDVGQPGQLEVSEIDGVVDVPQRVQIAPADLDGQLDGNGIGHGGVSGTGSWKLGSAALIRSIRGFAAILPGAAGSVNKGLAYARFACKMTPEGMLWTYARIWTLSGGEDGSSS